MGEILTLLKWLILRGIYTRFIVYVPSRENISKVCSLVENLYVTYICVYVPHIFYMFHPPGVCENIHFKYTFVMILQYTVIG